MVNFVDLSCRFRDLTGADIDEPKSLASFGRSGLLRAGGWVEVLRHRRVVLLAEAGPGKTREMRERVAGLRAEGKFAFFVELDDLDRDGLTVPLQTPDDERELAVWLADGASPARF
jgi:hypothetical protein